MPSLVFGIALMLSGSVCVREAAGYVTTVAAFNAPVAGFFRVPDQPDPIYAATQLQQRLPATRLARTDAGERNSEPRRQLGVRVGMHEEFTRLVFDWRAPVSYSVTEAGNKVTVTFARRARINLDRLRARLINGLVNPQVRDSDGGFQFSIEKPPGVNVRHFLVGAKVVLDFGAALPADPAVEAQPPAEADQASGKPPAAVESMQDEPEPRLPQTGRIPEGPPAPDKAAPAAENERTVLGKATKEPLPDVATLTFDIPDPAGAAVFRRDPYIWIVFDRRIQPSIDVLRKAAARLVESIEEVPVETGTAIRLLPKPEVNPLVEKRDNTWLVHLRRWPIAPQIPIELQVRSEGAEGAEMNLPVPGIGQVLQLQDPDAGDMLLVATLQGPGYGISVHRRYPQFEFLASAQGVAVKPLDDSIELRDAGEQGVALTRANGLHLSPVTSDGAVSDVAVSPRVFHFAAWSKGPPRTFNNALQLAIRATTEAPKERRDEAHLNLARLYFAHGMAPEAIGVMRTIEFAHSPLTKQPEFHALKGACLTHIGRYGEAREELLDSRLDRFQEIALWRASMYFGEGEFEKAVTHFRSGDAILKAYPEPYRTKFALEKLEAAIQTVDIPQATVWARQLDKRSAKFSRQNLARLRYNQGLLAQQERDLDRAVNYWTEVKATEDRWNSARAELALIELGLEQETISPDEAVERLEQLSYQWRGDKVELAVLNRLGHLYLSRGEYRKSLARMHTAVTYFPDSKEAKAAKGTMADVFKSLYLDGKAETLAPLDALALFEDFRELTPAGPEGDLMIRKLVDRLIGVDLLDRAAGLLAHQVQFRLTGQVKAESGAKLALIHLLGRNPKGALLALRASFQPDLPQWLEDDRRRIRAKAKLDMGQSEEAVALLAGDGSRDADLLRLDLYWATKNYSDAAKALERLAGEPLTDGAYEPEQAQYILKWAVALRLEPDEAGLTMLRNAYGAGMAKSPLAETFAFLVQSPGGSREDIEAIASRVGASDGIDTFLQNYRERLMPPTTAVSTEKTIQGEDRHPREPGRSAGADIPSPPPVPR